MVGRDLHPKDPWNTFPQVCTPSAHQPAAPLASARARAAADRRGKQSEGTVMVPLNMSTM